MQSLWMLLASLLFALMGACIKLATVSFTTSEIVFFRSVIGVVMLGSMSLARGLSLRTQLPLLHAKRGGIGVISLWLWFFTIAHLPLATAMTLNYMSPIWIATILFGANWLHGKVGFESKLVAAILLSFIGVLVLLRPIFASEQWLSSIVGLVSGVLSALAYLQVRELGLMGEPEYRVVFYFSLTGVIAGGIATMIDHASGQHAFWQHSLSDPACLLVLAVGVLATLAQVAMTRAYRLGNTLVTANLQYTGIAFSTVISIFVFQDTPDWHTGLGIGIILVSGVLATFYNTRKTTAVADAIARPSTGDIQ